MSHRHAAGDAAVKAIVLELDAKTAAALLFDQVFEQRAVAATEVEHAGALTDHLRDDVEVGSQVSPRVWAS